MHTRGDEAPHDARADAVRGDAASAVYTSAVGPEVVAAIIALSIAPVIITTQKSLQDSDEEEFRPIPW
jgi:hypothetical protein